MAEKIYTIPINDAFDKYDGCPLCRLRTQLEEQSLEYIMGAAMMEPDIRTETNRLGFCRRHYDTMLEMKNRLSLALMLESRLGAVDEALSRPDIKPGMLSWLKKNDNDLSGETAEKLSGSCYVCNRAESFERQYISNTVYVWKTDLGFRQKLKNQPFFCINHYGKLLSCGKSELSEALYIEFAEELYALQSEYIKSLSTDVTAFCRSFDHNNARTPLSDAQKTAIKRAIDFLAGSGYAPDD